MSEETKACIECHETFQLGVVQDWRSSRHALTTPSEALALPALRRRMSNESCPDSLRQTIVGCYECHSRNAASHADNFDHFGYRINVVVTPNDCRTCHSTEADQYAKGKKAHAVGNLENNSVFDLLVESVVGGTHVSRGTVVHTRASAGTRDRTCFACHGTHVKVTGMKHLVTAQGDIDVPALSNWPNQGVGRINPDGSAGACTACHPRHSFAIETARKPYTCSQCHLQPDVPAWDVFTESKHGNILFSKQLEYVWDAVPWAPGRDFRAPGCAACHASLLVAGDGSVVAERSHDFSSRLWVRIFGLPYAHPQPKDGATSGIRNKDGQPLPTTFSNEPAKDFLIDSTEQASRRTTMTGICATCHGTDWAVGHFAQLDSAVAESNAMTASATQLLAAAWKARRANASNPFDEQLEQEWIETWLFDANCIRYAAAMSGPDYATFKYGWWEMTKAIERMKEAKN